MQQSPIYCSTLRYFTYIPHLTLLQHTRLSIMVIFYYVTLIEKVLTMERLCINNALPNIQVPIASGTVHIVVTRLAKETGPQNLIHKIIQSHELVILCMVIQVQFTLDMSILSGFIQCILLCYLCMQCSVPKCTNG